MKEHSEQLCASGRAARKCGIARVSTVMCSPTFMYSNAYIRLSMEQPEEVFDAAQLWASVCSKENLESSMLELHAVPNSTQVDLVRMSQTCQHKCINGVFFLI